MTARRSAMSVIMS